MHKVCKTEESEVKEPEIRIHEVIIEKASLDDIDGIMRIEKESFRNHWPESVFIKDISKGNVFVAKVKGKVVGYISIERILDEVHIQNIAVDKRFRRMEIGSLLMKFAIESNPDCSFFLEVRPSNTPAIALYKKFGFQEVGIRKNYYSDEDAIIMMRSKTS